MNRGVDGFSIIGEERGACQSFHAPKSINQGSSAGVEEERHEVAKSREKKA
jgi:hypothetical protein